MPVYEYRCRECDTRFEARRPMTQADEPTPCPNGHPGSVRLLSVFASTGRASNGGAAPGVPCGPACACHSG